MADALNLIAIGHGHLNGVLALQARAYAPELHESATVLGSKLGAHCGISHGIEASNTLQAYAIAYRISHGAALLWNEPLAQHAPAEDDWLYVHDIAVNPHCVGEGLAARLMQAVLDAGRRLTLSRAMLVAVQGAEPYWARHGFVAQPAPVPVQGFGDDAVWMARAL